MTANPQFRRSRGLQAIAIAMLVTATGLLILVGLSLNRSGFEAEIWSLDPASGEELWSLRAAPSGRIAVAGDHVMVPVRGELWAVGPDGTVSWIRSLPGVTTIRPHGGILAVIARDDQRQYRAAVVDTATGEVIWQGPGYLKYSDEAKLIVADIATNTHRVINAATGETIGSFKVGGGGSLGGGVDGVAYRRGSTLRVMLPDGRVTVLAEDVPTTAEIGGVSAGAVVVSYKGGKPGKTVKAYDIATGAELWTKPIKDFRGLQFYRDGRRWSVEPRTGNVATIPPHRVSIPDEADDSIKGSVARFLGSAATESDRYLQIDGETFAVSRADGRVLWTRPGNQPEAVGPGVAVFKRDATFWIHSAVDGTLIDAIDRSKHSRAVGGPAGVAVSRRKKVLLVGSDGSITTVAKMPNRARIGQMAGNYMVVTSRAESGRDVRDLVVIDVSAGTQVLSRRGDFTSIELFEDSLELVTQAAGAEEIDLPPSDVTSAGDSADESGIAVFNADGSRLLWTRETAHTFDFDASDRSVFVWSTPSSHL